MTLNGDPPVDQWVREFQSKGLTRRQFTFRLLAAGLSLPAAAAFIEACTSGGGTTSGPVTLQFMKFQNDNDDKAIMKALDRWNQTNKDIQVKFVTVPFSDYLGAKLTTAFAAGTGPDIFWMSPGNFLSYVSNGIAAPLDDVVADVKSDYLDAAIKAVSVNGKVYSLPFEMEPVALYYRKDILSAAGVTPPTTWDELTAAAKKLTTANRSGVMIETAQNAYQNFTWYPFLWSAGGEVINADWTASALRTDAAASAFDIWGQLVKRGYAPKKTAAITADAGPLGRGETAMQVCGFWAIAQLKASFPDLQYGVVKLPAPAGKSSTTVYGGWTHMVSAKGKYIAQAKKFSKWLWMQDQTFPHDWACVTNTKFSPRNTVNTSCSTEFGTPPKDFFTSQVLPTARAEPRYPDQIVKAVGDGIQAALFTDKSGQQAAAVAADAIDSFLKTYKGAH